MLWDFSLGTRIVPMPSSSNWKFQQTQLKHVKRFNGKADRNVCRWLHKARDKPACSQTKVQLPDSHKDYHQHWVRIPPGRGSFSSFLCPPSLPPFFPTCCQLLWAQPVHQVKEQIQNNPSTFLNVYCETREGKVSFPGTASLHGLGL